MRSKSCSCNLNINKIHCECVFYNLFSRKSAEWDKPRHSPELHLTATQRIYENTEAALAEKREIAKKERILLDNQWNELKMKEIMLRENFVKLSTVSN